MRRVSCMFAVSALFGLILAAACDAAPTVLALKSQEPDASQGAYKGGKLLVRELARQALLIAARDELGVATRDMTLGESIPVENGMVRSLDLQILVESPASLRVHVSRTTEKKAVLCEQQVEFAQPLEHNVFDYAAFAQKCEALSRGEFVEALKKAGFADNRRRPAGTSEVSAQIARQLQEMNFFSQFAAVRGLHAQHHIEGESTQTLAALAQGYANLGRLTSFHWNAAHKAFLARALLYAQRLVNLDKTSANSLRIRAYAEALSGLHGAALADLERAAAADKKTQPAADPPAWLPIVEALCRYDRVAIREVKNERLRELAAVCSYLVLENSNCEGPTLLAGREALATVPECYAICDSMGRYMGVSNRHFTTVHGPATLLKTLPERLGEMPGLPAAVLRELEKVMPAEQPADPATAAGPQRAALVASLVEQGTFEKDDHEMSWELLGRLIEDVTFVQVFRRMEFFARNLGLPFESYRPQFDAALSVVSGHPFANAIKAIVLDPQRNAAQIRELLAGMEWADAGWSQYPVALMLGASSRANGAGVTRETMRGVFFHSDHLAQDLEQYVNATRQAVAAHQLQVVSPKSPHAVAALAMYDTKVSQAQLQAWDRDFAAHPPVLMSLAIRYQQLGQSADTERCLQRYVELAPDHWGFETLANFYWQQNQPEKWKETLDESLKHEDFALSHARSRVSIAGYFMDRKKWAEALPYADAAAETGAAWAMLCAVECHESLKQWEQSEQWIKLTAQRYREQELDWYFWCQRTGRGDLDGASKLAAPAAAKLARSELPADQERLGVYYLLAGKTALARTAFRKSHEQGNSPWPGMHWALMASHAKDTEDRDAALASVIARGPNYRPPDNNKFAELVEVARWMNNALHQPPGKEPDLAAIEAICAKAPYGRPNVEFFTGCFVRDLGKADLAQQLWQRSIDSGRSSYWNTTIASKFLRDAGAKARPDAAQK